MQEINWKFDVENIPLGVYFLGLYKDGYYSRSMLLKPQPDRFSAYAFIAVPEPKVEREWRTDPPPDDTFIYGLYVDKEEIVHQWKGIWETKDYRHISAPDAWCPIR